MNPPLLLHICCAPDEAWVVHSLGAAYDLRCFFCNPNIQPEDEYRKRSEEARKTAAHFGVAFDAEAYDPDSWEEAIREFCATPRAGPDALTAFCCGYAAPPLFAPRSSCLALQRS